MIPIAAASGVISGVEGILGLGGHSDLYTATLAAIPQYKARALAGDAGAYAILQCLSGNDAFHHAAVDAGQIGTTAGNYSGVCGGADATTKAMAKAAVVEVDARVQFALIAGVVTLVAAKAGTNAAPVQYTGTVAAGLGSQLNLGSVFSSSNVLLLAAGAVVLLLLLRRR